METNPTRMCEALVGLPDVNIEGVGDWPRWLRIAITTRAERPTCPRCAGAVWRHDDLDVELVDLPEFDGLIWPRGDPVATPPKWGQIKPSFSICRASNGEPAWSGRSRGGDARTRTARWSRSSSPTVGSLPIVLG